MHQDLFNQTASEFAAKFNNTLTLGIEPGQPFGTARVGYYDRPTSAEEAFLKTQLPGLELQDLSDDCAGTLYFFAFSIK